ncbi:FMN-linked oxidoreductase [Mycena indigotica]|uniref:tRNA-dihydrouridine synthase n=1 Tax=Mycena indigotica TaxID=2126181 RepID=A0A8H6TFF0_9AGAR|nr:FMN-linked oxidoreductase [Mycena indigotica]KAF7316264.1 FMN-linked oxidoreductase [Mycena indigotica]
MEPGKLSRICAPMVNQSDQPFRELVHRYGATLAYTQMLKPELLLDDQDYLELCLRDLTAKPLSADQPVVVQLCGNDPETLVKGGRKLQQYCHAIDLNLGCPQQAALDNHFGAYLLGQRDWPLVEEIVAAMSKSFVVPTSAKLRLCQPAFKTLELAERLEACGVSWITLHARTVSAQRRRHGPADLSQVKRLKDNLGVPIISNGNVRTWDDLEANLKTTGADGLMVGESLLGNPCLFANYTPDPVAISLEYLSICRMYPDVATVSTMATHVRHFVDSQCHRRPWYTKFRTTLANCRSLEEIEVLLQNKVQRWRGLRPEDDEEQPPERVAEAVEEIGDIFAQP